MKVCIACKENLDYDLYTLDKSKKDGLNPYCKRCISIKDSRHNRKSTTLQRKNKYMKNFRIKNPERSMYARAKSRAKDNNLDFTIELCDIVIPENCPILNIPLIVSGKSFGDSSPSLDRIDNSKGYIKGNICVISNKANMIKRDLTLEQINMIKKYIEDNLNVFSDF